MRQKKSQENIFVMPSKNTIFYRNNFKNLFIKTKNSILSDEESDLFDKILYLCEEEQLFQWESEALTKYNMNKKVENSWLGWFRKKEQIPEVEKVFIVKNPINNKWEIQLELYCPLIEVKLATYNLGKMLLQSQTMNLTNTTIRMLMNETVADLWASIETLTLIYFDMDSDSQVEIVNVNGKNGNPGIDFRKLSYSDIKTPNEIYYTSQEFETKIDVKCISHLLNFVSLKELSARYKKEIFDSLKSIQENAMNEISDIFYYEKIYRLNIRIPKVVVVVDAEKGKFQLTLCDLHVVDEETMEKIRVYSVLRTGVGIELVYNDMQLLPFFNIVLMINTLEKKYLKPKWDSKETPYDEYFDLEICGKIEKIVGNFSQNILEELRFIQSRLVIDESRETLLLDKKKIMKGCELISTVICNFGFSQSKCIVVLNDNAIYFFTDAKSLNAFDFIVVEDSVIQSKNLKIMIVNKFRTVEFEFSNEKDRERWSSLLFEKTGAAKAVVQKVKSSEKKIFGYNFVISHSNLNIFDGKGKIQYKVKIVNQVFNLTSNQYLKSASINMATIKIKDSENQRLLSCLNSEKSGNISIDYVQIDSKYYQGFDVLVDIGLCNSHFYIDQVWLKQLLNSQNKSKQVSEGNNEILLKAKCTVKVTDLEIHFKKLNAERGKFRFNYFEGITEYQKGLIFTIGQLKNTEVFWVESESKLQVPLFCVKNDKAFEYNITLQDGVLSPTLSIGSPQIIFIPLAYAKLQRYFNFIITSENPVENPAELVSEILIENPDEIRGGSVIKNPYEPEENNSKSAMKINVSVAITDVCILAKRANLEEKCIEVYVGEIQIEMKGEKTLIQIEKFKCRTDHPIVEETSICITQTEKFSQVKLNVISVFLNESDLKILNSLQSGPNKHSSIKKVPNYESRFELLIDACFFSIQHSSNVLKIICTSLELSSNTVFSESFISLKLIRANVLFNEQNIAEVSNEKPEVSMITGTYQTGRSEYSVNINYVKLCYSAEVLRFLYELLEMSGKVQGTQPVQHGADGETTVLALVSIKNIDVTLWCNEQQMLISTGIVIDYSSCPYSVSLKCQQINIWKDRPICTPMDLDFYITDDDEFKYGLLFNNADFCLCLDDIFYFQSLFYSIPSMKPKKNSLQKSFRQIEYQYTVNFSTVKIKFLSKQLEPIIEATIKNDYFTSSFVTYFKISSKFSLSLEYYNPILQKNESFIEPVIFLLSFSSNPLILNLQTLTNESLNFSITDFQIKHLTSLYYSSSNSNSAFSIYNNTGFQIEIGSNEGITQVIMDQSTENFKAPTEDTILKCRIIDLYEGNLTLSRIPLFYQDPIIHQLDRIRDINILTEVKIVNFSKLLRITSPLEIQNNTDLELDIAFILKTKVQSVKTSAAKSKISVPLDCTKSEVSIIDKSSNLKECDRIEIQQIKKKSTMVRSGGYFFVLEFMKNTLHIWPSFIAYSYLPQPLLLSIFTSHPIETLLLPGLQNNFYIATNKPVKTSITPNNFIPFTSLELFSKKKIPETISLENSNFSLEIGVFMSNDPIPTLILYPLVLLVNLSLLPLQFHIQLKNSIPCISENIYENRIPCNPCESILIKTSGELSSPIDIKTKPTGFFEVSGENNTKFSLNYSITNGKIPNQDLFAKVVTINSRILITNHMEQDLKVIQFGASVNNFILAPSGKTNYFNWENCNSNSMSVKVTDISSDWTGAFDISTSTTFYLRSDSENTFSFIKVDVKDEDDTKFVGFYNSVETDLKIENCSMNDVVYFQENFAFPLVVKSNSYSFFAWHSQVNSKTLVLQVKNGREKYSTHVSFAHSGELLQFDSGPQGEITYVLIRKEANTQTLVISDTPLLPFRGSEILSKIDILVPEITFSIIQQNVYHKKEILLIVLASFNFAMNQFKDLIYWKLEFSDLQIDCQIHEYVVCPILVLTNGPDTISMEGELVISEKWFCLDKVFFKFKNMLMNVDSNSLKSVLKFLQQFEIRENQEILSYLYLSDEVKPVTPAYVYLSRVELSAFQVAFSYKLLPSNFSDTFKSYFLNFDNVTVALETCLYKGLYGSMSSLSFTFFNTYKKMVIANISQILKQHGMIGGALTFFLKLSGSVSSIGKKKNKQDKNKEKAVNIGLSSSTSFFRNLVESKTKGEKSSSAISIGKTKKEQRKRDVFLDFITNPLSWAVGVIEDKKVPKNVDVANTKRRKRAPRIFYGKVKTICPFDSIDCNAANYFIEKQLKHSVFSYYGQAIGTDLNGNLLMFVFFLQKIALVNIQKDKVMWEIDPIRLEPIVYQEKSVLLVGTTENNSRYKHEIRVQESEVIKKIESLMQILLKDLMS